MASYNEQSYSSAIDSGPRTKDPFLASAEFDPYKSGSQFDLNAYSYPPPTPVPYIKHGEKNSRNQDTARRYSIPLLVRLPALAVGIISTGLATAILVWLVFRRYDPSNSVVQINLSGITVRELAKNSGGGVIVVGLLISSVATQVVSLTAPLLMGIVAYRLGVDWYEATATASSKNLPTPHQYGLIINIFSVGSLSTIMQTAGHVMSRKGKVRVPRLLTQAFTCLILMWFLPRLIGLADLALHSTTTSLTLPGVDIVDPTNANYGTSINQSAIAERSSASIAQEGVFTAGNRSSVNQVFTLDSENQMAYIGRVSNELPTGVSFIASSLGIETQCVAITPQCYLSAQFAPSENHFDYDTPYNCTAAGYPEYALPPNSTFPFMVGVPPSQLTTTSALAPPLSISQNPFQAGYFDFLAGTDDPTTLTYTNFTDIYANQSFAPALKGFFLIMACNVSVYDITLRYSDGNYTLINKTMTPPSLATFATSSMTTFSSGFTQALLDDAGPSPLLSSLEEDIRFLSTADIPTPQDLNQVISNAISRYVLAYSAGYLSAIPAAKVASTGIVTRYSLGSVTVDMLFIYAYAVLALYIFAWSSKCFSAPSGVGLNGDKDTIMEPEMWTKDLVYNAQLRISQPASLVAELFRSQHVRYGDEGRPHVEGWASESVVQLFDSERDGDVSRLATGLRRRSDGDGHTTTVYGVWSSAPQDSSVRRSAGSLDGSRYGTVPGASGSHQSKRVSIPLLARIPALFVSIGAAGLGIGLVGWIVSRKYDGVGVNVAPIALFKSVIPVLEPAKAPDGDGQTETLLVGLLISSVTTQFISLTGPFILGIVAYHLGANWFEASRCMETAKLPTPHQFAMVMNIFSMGSISAMLDTGGYLMKRKNRPQHPPILIQAFLALVTVFSLTRLQGLADLALHSTTTATAIPAVNLIEPSSSLYGTSVNQSAMVEHQSNPTNLTSNMFRGLYDGILTAGNRSNTNQVFTLAAEQQMAYMGRLTGQIPTDVSFIAPSVGIAEVCQNITPQCFNVSVSPSTYGFNCTPAGLPDISNGGALETYFSVPVSALGPNPTLAPYPVLSNPFPVAYQVGLWNTPAAYPTFNNSLVEITGDPDFGSFLIIACNLSIYDIVLHYSEGRYSLQSKTLSSISDASFATYPFIESSTYHGSENDNVVNTTFPINLRLLDDILDAPTTNADFMDIISPDIARLVLAFSSGFLSTSSATTVATSGVITQYPIVALGVELLFVFLYAALAMGIFIWASSSRMTYDESDLDGATPESLAYNAQLRIAQPASLVAALFNCDSQTNAADRHRPEGWAEKSTDELFQDDDTERPIRLTTGLRTFGAGAGMHHNASQEFGIWGARTDS